LAFERDKKWVDRIVHHSKVKKEEGTAAGVDRIGPWLAFDSQIVEIFLKIPDRKKL